MQLRGPHLSVTGQQHHVRAQERAAVEVLDRRDHRGLGEHLHQPFTAPAVMPATIFRLKKMNMISGGMVISTMFMNSRLY